MTNTTDEYWDVDGVSLQTYAQNIESWGNSRWGAVPLRGQNILIPHRPGRLWTPKVPDSRVITLAGWVRGCNPDGSVSGDRHDKFVENWQALRDLFWNTGDRQIALTKRWGPGGTAVAVAQAQFVGGLEPSMIGTSAAKFTVDLELADPYFYSPAIISETVVSGSPEVILNPGQKTSRLVLSFSGGGPYNLSHSPSGWSIDVDKLGDVHVDVEQFRAIHAIDGSVTSQVTTQGGGDVTYWFGLERGSNTLVLTGGGSVEIEYQAAYL